jgi:hypothetical protein
MNAPSRWRRPAILFVAVTAALLAIAVGIELAARLAGSAWE